ncbi:hypothetical protein [Edaphobacter modestus]|uniref:Uncharacterized protein n=1 Tax=Edaphobacter modestus TaxID=388466 RepID=A0A4Q7YSN5_9BACT|nr:hypothetical protein [Edaphobacter modestus]RZU40812.1 hypothetical protein BDD14_2297 [Edaphobacter modestus]
MPIGPNSFLSLLTFPQSWDGASLTVRFLCLPKGDPFQPLQPGLPSFSSANLVFEANMIGSLARLPQPADATSTGPLVLDGPPLQKIDLFTELTTHFTIRPIAPNRTQASFRKAITPSYQQLIGNRQHSPLLLSPDEFACAQHQGVTDQPDQPSAPSSDVSWGRLMAYALRQPNFAAALGLMGQATVTPADPAFFAEGGWLYIDLHPTSDYAGVDILARYAARIPKLSVPRPVFAAVLFPVTTGPDDSIADDIFREAQTYDDGLAKLVHCAQNTDAGDSIQLAWDDEQIAEWLHRQVQLNPDRTLMFDRPNGVAGFRVDVRKQGDDAWSSLLRIESIGDVTLGPFSLGSFQGEGVVEVAPAQLSPKQAGAFWLPPYFATWRGSSLALTDPDLTSLHARPEVQNPDPAAPPQMLNREKVFQPVGDKDVRLQYGNTYEFRVRLSDLTRGGPDSSVSLPEPHRNSLASLTFQRRKPPAHIEVLQRPSQDSRQLRIARPRLGHPEALFTGSATFADLEDDLAALAADPKLTREISVPDPDVLTVEIEVQLKALDGDLIPYLPLYKTTRTFDGPEMTLDLAFEDHDDLITLASHQPDEGPLALPTARALRLQLIAVGRDKPGYFAEDKLRRGAQINIDLRAAATAESDLLGEPEGFSSLRSFFFQPPPSDNSVPSPTERLAAELGLDHLALTLSGRAAKRTVVACSSALRHTLSPEGSSITFSSGSDLVQRWINVVKFDVLRDWTWDGLKGDGIAIDRIVRIAGRGDVTETVASFRLPRVIGPKALTGTTVKTIDAHAPVRQVTELLFFDAFDPKPRPLPAVPPAVAAPAFPSEITIDYVARLAFDGPASDEVSRSILLPVTTPPSQTPRILSAGLALSEYIPADDYSSSNPRRRMLWFEFDQPPLDPEDAYFVRVLARGPDPLLLAPDTRIPDAAEPPLPIDSEWMRLITPGQPRDESGLSAMQPLEGSPTAPKKYLVPLPPDLQPSSPDLFGFFTYEVRVGHTASRWSTAQSRFGPMLRIAGVQHPAPPLVCQAARDATGVRIQAPYAAPVFNGVNLRPLVPKTDLWALLYARVRQADGQAWRNILLAQIQLFAPHEGNDPEHFGLPILYGEGLFPTDLLTNSLLTLGLPLDEPLTALVSEIFEEPTEATPLGARLGQARMLRISPLVPVPDAC